MTLSPELRTMPENIYRFNKSGLTWELIGDMVFGRNERDIVSDSRKLLDVINRKDNLEISGIENIPEKSGCFVVFNHPNMDILVPAMLNMIVKAKDLRGKMPKLLQGSEIPLVAKYNETKPLPGSVFLMKRFHKLYSNFFISVPISKTRKDYETGRFVALRKAIRAIKEGDMLLVAPEGHVERMNTISPVETFHEGSGGIAIIAGKLNLPSIPVGIWGEEEKIHVKIGKPFIMKTFDEDEAVVQLMAKIAAELPEKLRGPFS